MAQRIPSQTERKSGRNNPRELGKLDYEDDAAWWQVARDPKLKREMRTTGAPSGGRRPARDG
jgi:hypothetical protein